MIKNLCGEIMRSFTDLRKGHSFWDKKDFSKCINDT